MLDEKTLRRMKDALAGVVVADAWLSRDAAKRLLERARPPSYLVRLVLQEVFGTQLRQVHDKSEWAIPLMYKGNLFEIADWKRYRWEIYSSVANKDLAVELAGKLSSAAKLMDGYLAQHCKDRLKTEDFALHNQFPRYMSFFELFRQRSAALLEEMGSSVPILAKSEFSDLADYIGSRFNAAREVQGHLIAAVVFFFSMSEIILDACFALGERHGLTYQGFRRLDWRERFKKILPVGDREVEREYRRLLKLRKIYRNIPVHGSPLLLFPLPGIGLIPATIESLDDPNVQPVFVIDVNDARTVLADLERSLALLKDHPRTQFGFAYAESGLAIHLSGTRLRRYQTQDTPIADFRQMLEEEVERLDSLGL